MKISYEKFERLIMGIKSENRAELANVLYKNVEENGRYKAMILWNTLIETKYGYGSESVEVKDTIKSITVKTIKKDERLKRISLKAQENLLKKFLI